MPSKASLVAKPSKLPVQDDFTRWLEETGLLYDQVVARFYRALTDADHNFLEGYQVDVFGDNRPWSNTGL